ncbi:MAG: nucleotidyl transferase AbiEii/AbiGii toxin family protein [Deltaproteobacteria bacterium]|nr:nucleotidyl transferase AbiEii/AbiGii toxin family protein [Deltaproteobacteria bacterium]
MPAARVRDYPKETVVLEKTQAAVRLSMQNSRVKDFYDLLRLSRLFFLMGRCWSKQFAPLRYAKNAG